MWAMHGLHTFCGFFNIDAGGGNKQWPPTNATNNWNRPRPRITKSRLRHADDRNPFVQGLMQNGAEPRPVIGIEPNITVDDDHSRQLPDFF